MKVGLSNISIFLPQNYLNLSMLLKNTAYLEKSEFHKRFSNAVEYTQQKGFRFTLPNEDVVTMASEAVLKLINENKVNSATLRYLIVGTESTLDYSKPLSSYILSSLSNANLELNNNIINYQVQFACAATSLSLFSTASLLLLSHKREQAIVVASDIARYEPFSTAEVTQGAGAVALLLEKNPKLISLNTKNFGIFSASEDDFYRPLNSPYPKVKGKHSLECYYKAFEEALKDFAFRSNLELKEIFAEYHFILHVPFAKMPLEAMKYVLKKYYLESEAEINAYLEEINFFSTIELTKTVGNIYTGSLYLSLFGYLKELISKKANLSIGQKFLLCSYGSGNIMFIMEFKVEEGAESIVSKWDFNELFNKRVESDFETYKQFTLAISRAEESEGFFLKSIRDDGYRIYGYRK